MDGDELFGSQLDVAGDFPEKNRRNITPLVEGNRRSAAVRVAELFVRAALSDLDESNLEKPRDNFLRFEDRQFGHRYGTCTACVPTNSASISGSPSSRSMAMTSDRFRDSSSSVSPWEWAPGNPGT
jgi:hypothetical protein